MPLTLTSEARRDAECVEMNGKYIFQFLQILWSSLNSKLVHYRWISITKSTISITQKIEVAEIEKLIFHSFQHIAHHLLKWEHLWGGLHIQLTGRNPISCMKSNFVSQCWELFETIFNHIFNQIAVTCNDLWDKMGLVKANFSFSMLKMVFLR